MMKRDRNPYACFKSDRDRLFALMSRDLRIVLVVAIASFAGAHPTLRGMILGWIS